jgi:anaerobic selenocysteine-containing dehydrogenase
VSRWTNYSVPNNWDVVKDIPRRGGKVRFVNPRRTESSTSDTGPTIFIRPGTDAYFLAAVLHEIVRRHGWCREAIVEKYGKHMDQLCAFVNLYPAQRVTGVTGVPIKAIQTVADDFLTARSAVALLATGVNQSRQGVICAWLIEMLNFVTGNLGRKGGMYKPAGLMDSFESLAGFKDVKTSIGNFSLPDPIGYSALPAALLPQLIEAGDIRALIVLSGNPLLSVGGGEKARAAYKKLDLLVAIDIYRSATGELCDYVLPATDWLERPDFNLTGNCVQPIPYVQYTQAMVDPAAGRRNEWWILARLLQAIGVGSPLDAFPDEMSGSYLANGILAGHGLTVDQLMMLPSQTMVFPQASYDSLFERCLKHADGKIDCYPELFVSAGLIERCETIFQELDARGTSGLSLISLRTPYLHNTWLSNSLLYRRGKNAENPLHMTEHDAAALGLFAGDEVRVSTAFGTLDTRILIDDDLCHGTVAMSHGFGQERSYSLKVAQRSPGANCNSLMPIGEGSYEPLSYMSWLSGVPVSVEKIAQQSLRVNEQHFASEP